MLDYLEDGLDVDGVDNSPEMLALCRARAAESGLEVDHRLFQQEMEALSLPRRYATLIVPSSSFQLLTDPAAAARALARFHDHLEPGGLVVVPFMSKLWPGRRTPPQMQWADMVKVAEATRPGDGAVIRRWMRTCFDHEQQLLHEENRYEMLRDGEVVETELHLRSPSVRWYSQGQALDLFAPAGLAVTAITSGFSLDPAGPDDTLFCILATRAT